MFSPWGLPAVTSDATSVKHQSQLPKAKMVGGWWSQSTVSSQQNIFKAVYFNYIIYLNCVQLYREVCYVMSRRTPIKRSGTSPQDSFHGVTCVIHRVYRAPSLCPLPPTAYLR